MQKQVLFVSHTADSGVFRVGSHHLAREMSKLGLHVAHVSTPWSLLHSLLRVDDPERKRLAAKGPIVDNYGVVHGCSETLLPSSLSGGGYLKTLLERIGFENPDLVLIDQPLMQSSYLCKLGRTRIYRPTDLYMSRATIERQNRLLPSMHGLIATSPNVMAALPERRNQPRMVIENGVEFERFATESDTIREGAVYVGAIDDRFDWNAVIHFAELVPSQPFTIAGPLRNMPPSHLPANVRLTGPMPYDDVPDLLATAKFGLLPFVNSDVNAGRSPMKLYEYLAAGLFVIAKRQGTRGEHHIPGLSTYETYPDSDGDLLEWLAQPEANLAGVAIAQHEDWSIKAVRILEFYKEITSNDI